MDCVVKFGNVKELLENHELLQLKDVEKRLSTELEKVGRNSREVTIQLLNDGKLTKDRFAESFIPSSFARIDSNTFFTALRTRPDGNCLYNSVSIALYGNDSWARHLRLLTSIELFLNRRFYSKHQVFENAFLSQKQDLESARPLAMFFRMSLKNSTVDKCDNNNDFIEKAVEYEAISNCEDNEWSSFMCLLGLSSVIKQKIQSVFPDRGAYLERLLKNKLVIPREESCTSHKIFILFCQVSGLNISIRSGFAFRANHFVPLVEINKVNTKRLKAEKPQQSYQNGKALKRPKLEFPVVGDQPKKLNQSTIMFPKATVSHSDHLETKPALGETEDNNTLHTLDCSQKISNTANESPASAATAQPNVIDTLRGKLDVSTFRNICLKGISDFEKLNLIKNVFVPDKNYKFEKPEGSDRKFLHNWLSQYSWLCFSHNNQGAYCLPCALFSGKDINAKKLISEPFTNYKKATILFKKHEESKEGNHSKCFFTYSMFLKEMSGKSLPVSATLTAISKQNNEDDKNYLLSIIDTILLCAQLGLPFRGNKDSLKHQGDPDQGLIKPGIGNFIAILQFVARQGNTLLEKHLKDGSKRAKYTSAPTQNLLLQCAYEVMTEKIVAEIKESKYFAILADEAADLSNLEQMAFCIRFVDKECQIREEFLQFIDCSGGVSAECLYNNIKNALSSLNLDIADCRGQGYDGASTMSGYKNGVAARIRGDNDKAVYTHCFNHRLNLAVSSTYNIVSVRNAMDSIREITDFFNNSPIRENLLKDAFEQLKMEFNKLVSVCQTRWLERITAFDRFHKFYVIIFTTLKIMTESDKVNVNTRSKGSQLLKKMMDFEFIFITIVLKHIFGYTKQTTELMQTQSIDILKGIEFIKSEISHLEAIRKNPDEKHDSWFKSACEIGTKIDVVPTQPRVCVKQVHRNNMPSNSPSDYFKRAVTLPIIDLVLNQLKQRFSTESEVVLNGLYVLPHLMLQYVGSNKKNIWRKKFLSFLELYDKDFEEFSEMAKEKEIELWEHHWQRKDLPHGIPDSISETLEIINVNKIFVIINRALRILGTVPVTSCTCERSFSALRHLKTYTQTTMKNDRLNAIALIYMNKGTTNLATKEKVLQRFNQKGPHRLNFE